MQRLKAKGDNREETEARRAISPISVVIPLIAAVFPNIRRESPMAKGIRGASRRLSSSSGFRWHPYSKAPTRAAESELKNKLTSEKKDWEDATCSVCLEYPHLAVLLLCSSHDKGCRPYMCGTSYRHSNCLSEFQKAYAKEISLAQDSENCKSSAVLELACPLCRGKVKGFTVVEPAREYLNKKKRSCMHENCSFFGTYKQLRKHVKTIHPRAKPRKVNPALEQKWKMLEHQRERADVISTIRSSMPGSVVLGDYVIDMNSSDSDGAAGNDINRRFLSFILRGDAASWLFRLPRENNNTTLASDGPEEYSTRYTSDEDDDDDDDDGIFVRSLRTERQRHRHRHRHRRSRTTEAR